MLTRYFDNAATTPIDPRVLEVMLPWLKNGFGNANSPHSFGRQAREAVEGAREQVAQAIGASDPEQIVFTSGATEGNNWVLKDFDHGAVSPFEHSSVREVAQERDFQILANTGITLFPPTTKVELISVMAVNNEIGAWLDYQSLRAACKVLHTDITQAAAKYAVDLTGVDYATFSSHKFYGPKGVGALYMADTPLPPFMGGGEQESGLRAGTLNVAGIVGMGEAARIAAECREIDATRAQKRREIVLEELEGLLDVFENRGENQAPNILSLSFLGLEGETLVIEADAESFAISSGAACSTGSTEPSHVLVALGIEPEWLRGTIRISFGRFNSDEAATQLGRTLKKAAERLRVLGT